MPELGKSGSVGAAGEQSPAATRHGKNPIRSGSSDNCLKGQESTVSRHSLFSFHLLISNPLLLFRPKLAMSD